MKRFNVSEWALNHRGLVLYFMIALFLTGALAFTQLGQSEDPPFTFKVMVISTKWPGATAHEVGEQITDKIEKKLQEEPRARLPPKLLEGRASRWCSSSPRILRPPP